MLALAGTDEGIFLENIFIGFQYWEIFFYFPTRFQVLNIKCVFVDCVQGRKESCCRWGYSNILSQDKLDMIFRAKNSLSGKCRHPPRTCLNMSEPGPQQPILEFGSWSSALGNKPFPLSPEFPSCVPLPWFTAFTTYDAMLTWNAYIKYIHSKRGGSQTCLLSVPSQVTCVSTWQKGNNSLSGFNSCTTMFALIVFRTWKVSSTNVVAN